MIENLNNEQSWDRRDFVPDLERLKNRSFWIVAGLFSCNAKSFELRLTDEADSSDVVLTIEFLKIASYKFLWTDNEDDADSGYMPFLLGVTAVSDHCYLLKTDAYEVYIESALEPMVCT